jgi:hypothetical protein
VYAGHAAIALALKARAPQLPIATLVLACYGPDWAELVFGLFQSRAEMRELTHTIPVVVVGAALAALLFAVVFDRASAWYVGAAWLSHWPADFVTAQKPLMHPQQLAGFDLYQLPAADFVVEAGLVALCCLVYARAFVRTRRQGWWLAAAAAGLIGLQALVDFGIAYTQGRNGPSLALRQRQPHLTVGTVDRVRMPLALLRRTPTVS